LAEVLVVLALLGIMTFAVAPALRVPGPQDGLGAAAMDLARVLRRTRLAALASGEDLTLEFDASTATYRVVTTAEVDVDSSLLGAGALTLQPGVTLASPDVRARFRFDRRGSAEGDSVSVRASGGTAVVSVERWTGAVVVRLPTGRRVEDAINGR
jgi:Tfp pilus assembly protein FimT